MLNLPGRQIDGWQMTLQRCEARKAHLLRQGRLLTEAYEAGQLQTMLAKLKAEQQRMVEGRLSDSDSRYPPAMAGFFVFAVNGF